MNMELIKNYLRIDFEDDDTLLAVLYDTADIFLKGAISKWDSIKVSPKYKDKVIILQSVVIQSLYDNRGLDAKEPKMNIVISSLISQLDSLSEEEL